MVQPSRNEHISREAWSLHQQSLVVDLHADTLIVMRGFGYDITRSHRFRLPRAAWCFHCDLPRWLQGGVNGQFFGLVTFPFPRRGCAASVLRQIDRLQRVCRQHPDRIRLVRKAAELDTAQQQGYLAALLGIEGAHNLEGDLANVARFRQAGVRYLGLAHFSSNAVAPAAFGLGGSNNTALPGLGREVVAAANEQGLIIDLAHVGRRAFLEAARLARRPLLVSHTGLQALCPKWRNIDDEQVRAVADRDGVIGIIFTPRFLHRGGRRDAGLVVEHLEYLRKTVGVRHAALGSDFDGFVVPPRDLPDVSHLPWLTQRLLERRWSDDDIRAVLGQNVRRVLAAHDDGAFDMPAQPACYDCAKGDPLP